MPSSLTERVHFGGPEMTAAYQFWFGNPNLDMGHALELADDGSPEMRFRRSETGLGAHAPRLTITYRLPAAPHPAPEVSPAESDRPLLVQRADPALSISVEDDQAGVEHEVFEGAIGSWYSHVGAGCVSPIPTGTGRLTLIHLAGSGSRYVLVGASSGCAGSLGTSTLGEPLQLQFSPCR